MMNSRELLVRAPNWAGDLVMATPALRALRAGLPGARITVAAPAGLAPLLAGAPWLDEVVPIRARGRGLAAELREARTLRSQGFDLGVCMPDAFSAALWMRAAGVRHVVGYRTDLRRPLLAVAVDPPRRGRRRAWVPRERHVLGLVEALGLEPCGTHLELFTTGAERATAARALWAAGVPAGAPYVALAPGASYGPSKLWPTASFARVGDAALVEYTRRFDRLDPGSAGFAVSGREVAEAVDACVPEALDALKLAAGRIEAYHRRQYPEDLDYTDESGVALGARWRPVAAAGLYVPGGTAAYPSSVLMNAVPARVAGVGRIVMVVPTPDGRINPLVLAAAHIAGVSEIYRVGGAQAVAALAFGTATIAPVDKIVGPGNAYVAAAKRQVFGVVGIDSIAGPSEILVVADSANDPRWIAVDLLSQAEHDTAAQSILVTDDADFADAVTAAVDQTLPSLARAEIAGESWRRHGLVIRVDRLDQAPALVDRIAPEHLELAVADPEALAARIRNAGAMFLGRHTPEAVGDYVAGPNHVLPTGRTARFSSGLSVLDFMKRTSIVRCDAEALAAIGPAAVTLAECEGLGAHALSVAVRLNRR